MKLTPNALRERRLTYRFLRATALVAKSIALASEHVLRSRPDLERIIEHRFDTATDKKLVLQARCFHGRLHRLGPYKRGSYSPGEIADILEFGAANGLTNKQLAAEFLVTEQTVHEWHKTLRTDRPARKPGTPIRSHHQALQKLTHQLAEHGVAVGESVRLFLRAAVDLPLENVRRWTRTVRLTSPSKPTGYSPVPPARRPNHVWNIDISQLRRKWRIALGHLTVIYDAFSRNPLAACLTLFKPSATVIRALIARAIARFGRPVYLLSDREGMFKEESLKNYLKRRQIKQRYGKLGEPHSISVLERFWKTIKELLARHPSQPIRFERLVQRTRDALTYYSFHRPSTALNMRTPAEAYGLVAAKKIIPIRPRLYFATEQPPELPLKIAWIDEDRTLPIIVREAA